MKRVLVTGSREWADCYTIYRALQRLSEKHSIIVVHGDCPTGADHLAERAARKLGVPTERHPADWSLGKKAGPLRNQKMVDLGADLCLAFPLPGSRGTLDCMRRAKAAGIKIVNLGES